MDELSVAEEERRLEALRRYDVLDSEKEPIFDDITRLLGYVCKAPASSISFVDRDRLYFKSEFGLGEKEIRREGSFCSHCIRERGLYIVPDARKSPLFAGGDPRLRFYAGAPIITGDGYAIGTVNVLDFVPRTISREQGDLLLFMARQVMSSLELRYSLKQKIQAEEFNRSILESTQDCIQILDRKGRIQTTIKGVEGCPEPRETTGSMWLAHWSAPSQQTVSEALARASNGEIVRFQAAGFAGERQCWWDVILTPMRSQEHERGRLLAVARDITNSKSLEEKLQQSKQAAEHASKAKDDFMAVLSHELRTPLAPVLIATGFVEKRSPLSHEQHKALEIIRHNVELEARLIDDLLDLTRIVQGKISLEKQPLDLSLILSRVVEICRPEIELKNLRFNLDVQPGGHPLSGDAGRLHQVFWNLLKNAIKFTAHGGEITLRCFSLDHREVITEVIDNGAGFDPSVKERIFNAFEQAAPDISRQFGGLGLGLAISRRIIELHDGSIEGHSEGIGKGAIFTVRLPQVQSARAEPARHASRHAASHEHKLRILVVEDHHDTSEMISMALNSLGHEVRTAETAASAMQIAGREHFDLLLSDLGLPDRDGKELLRDLKAAGQKLPAVAISGYGREEDVRHSREAGFAAHLTKPISMDELENVLERVL